MRSSGDDISFDDVPVAVDVAVRHAGLADVQPRPEIRPPERCLDDGQAVRPLEDEGLDRLQRELRVDSRCQLIVAAEAGIDDPVDRGRDLGSGSGELYPEAAGGP